MIFVPLQPGTSLTTIVEGLADGFHSLSRFALAENLWELVLERSNPEKNISFLREQSGNLHLNTTVRRAGFLKYDNPGDFQLMLRSDIFKIGGFDERMLKGWHVDSNLCKRMALLGRSGQSLEDRLIAFHCNHNQQQTVFHSKVTENDWGRFVTNVASAGLDNQNWGLADEEIEEVRLHSSDNSHVRALTHVLSGSEANGYDITVDLRSFNKHIYSSARILAYLTDLFCHIPKSVRIAYVGYNTRLLKMVECYLQETGFQEKVQNGLDSASETWVSQSSIFIFDFGFDETSSIEYGIGRKKLKTVMKSFLKVLKSKNLRADAKFIGVNLLHTDFNALFLKHLSVRNNGHAAGISYGWLPVKSKAKKPFFSLASRKKKMIFMAQYFVVRHLFKYSDRIRSFLARTKAAKKLFKSLG